MLISNKMKHALLKFVCHQRSIATKICAAPRYDRSIVVDRRKNTLISNNLTYAALKFVCHRRAVTTKIQALLHDTTDPSSLISAKSITSSNNLEHALLKFVCHRRVVTTINRCTP
ncbi:unnamed protein product [Polarella glacialis]|uniref:Uncharacterized protein n=1 Tax=Polarella glacialis TaxID=89957 RepID=A0A813DBI6_POLGL|nr:unnamed protein product [Polarella glacialis]CAE8624546.1 unnamed protein product [Polarella glacialis]